tara:strand:+ start:4031 stop:4426 length:396 start_codon:yes stop_codon:yes gene_type:complete
MPSESKDDGITRFRMDTEAFVTIWRNHIANPKADDWKVFVLNCFERFSPEDYNTGELNDHDDKWTDWSDDQQYEFLSERCYSKCMTIKGKLKREKNYNVELPDGYLSRAGTKKRKRVSLDDIANIFEGKDI